jgi:hypothetical protein
MDWFDARLDLLIRLLSKVFFLGHNFLLEDPGKFGYRENLGNFSNEFIQTKFVFNFFLA